MTYSLPCALDLPGCLASILAASVLWHNARVSVGLRLSLHGGARAKMWREGQSSQRRRFQRHLATDAKRNDAKSGKKNRSSGEDENKRGDRRERERGRNEETHKVKNESEE